MKILKILFQEVDALALNSVETRENFRSVSFLNFCVVTIVLSGSSISLNFHSFLRNFLKKKKKKERKKRGISIEISTFLIRTIEDLQYCCNVS